MTSPKATMTDHLRDAADSLLTEWEKLHAVQEPDFLWHYTSVTGLHGILETGNLRFSDAAFLNDTSEMSHAVDLLQTTVEDRIREFA